MTLKQLKSQFNQRLVGEFPPEEIQSFLSILSEDILGYNRFQASIHAEEELLENDRKRFENALERLANHEPIQYITGETEFYGLPFKVNPHTLIPRPETEELVEWILQTSSELQIANPKIIDIGTGSGCIAVSLAKHLEKAEVHAVDISEEALNIAKENAAINEVEIHFFQQDILSEKMLPLQYDIIVSNPPYVRNLEKERMHRNVVQFEPATALYVTNEDPLLFYRTIAQLAQTHLKPNGFLFFEINEYLSEEMLELLKTEGFSNITIKKDIFKKPRMLKCTL